MSLRIRQIVLAARDLDSAIGQFQDYFGLQVIYRDPEVAKFGLKNAMFAIGDQFIEIVTPIRADTAASRHLERHGDSAYMLILQTDDLSRDRTRLAQLGVRIVWESSFPDMRAAHLHPKDVGAAIVSLDEATPPDSWRWAGPEWQHQQRTPGRIVDATIAARDPLAMSARWAQVLGLDATQHGDGALRIELEAGGLNFISSADDLERIVEFGVESTARSSTICGTRFRTGP